MASPINSDNSATIAPSRPLLSHRARSPLMFRSPVVPVFRAALSQGDFRPSAALSQGSFSFPRQSYNPFDFAPNRMALLQLKSVNSSPAPPVYGTRDAKRGGERGVREGTAPAGSKCSKLSLRCTAAPLHRCIRCILTFCGRVAENEILE